MLVDYVPNARDRRAARRNEDPPSDPDRPPPALPRPSPPPPPAPIAGFRIRIRIQDSEFRIAPQHVRADDARAR